MTAELLAGLHSVDELGPCDLWDGYRFSNGYGRRKGEIARETGTQLVHRQTWIIAHGPIPAGLVIMHLCDNPPCVNLDHLRPGTHAENMRDAAAKGRRLQSHCPNGHEYTPTNTRLLTSGGRSCRTCERARDARRRASTSTRLLTPTGRVRSTHCPRGHEYTAENTYLTTTGGRRCRTCERARDARRRATSTRSADGGQR